MTDQPYGYRSRLAFRFAQVGAYMVAWIATRIDTYSTVHVKVDTYTIEKGRHSAFHNRELEGRNG